MTFQCYFLLKYYTRRYVFVRKFSVFTDDFILSSTKANQMIPNIS